MKPSSILNFKNNTNGLYEYWQDYENDFLMKYGLSREIISIKEDLCQILFYDNHNLSSHLGLRKHESFLSQWGYSPCCSTSLKKLHGQIQVCFPHESGIFFGIPLEDVKAFMENKVCIYQGYWKVYEQKKRAEKIFHYYDASKHLILSCTRNELLPKAKNAFLNQKDHLYA